ncbi:hypothetical protein [Maribacter aestuarii]|uniref:hypothetical protein n=1 Tax=Maribacter aestuarii TaxID=1130723 RepID=UPI00248CEE03|nr:hypothetical protein [Maribacter aestuarii]
MVDLIKYFLTNRELAVKNIEDSNNVDLRICINSKTGEILDKRTAYYKNMFIEITENRATLKGSIHKYFNVIEDYGEQNFNDFSYCDFKYAINNLQNTFHINDEETHITNLEFGLNIDIDINPQKLIDNYILMYDFKPPNRNEKFYGKGDYLEFKTTDYSLKIYNKSKQNSLKNRNILRVELKITGARYLKKHFSIYSLNDLDKNRFKRLFEKLLEHFDKLLIVDALSIKNLNRIDEMILFQNGISSSYWKELKNAESYKFRSRCKEDFHKVLKKHNLLKTKTMLKVQLKFKYKELMNCDCAIFKNVA